MKRTRYRSQVRPSAHAKLSWVSSLACLFGNAVPSRIPVCSTVVVERMPKKPEKPKEKTLLELKIEEREKREKAQKEMVGHQADGPTRELEEFGGGLEEALDSVALGSGPADPLDEAIKMSTAKDPPLREPKLPSANEFVAKTDADFETLSKMMYSQLKPYEGRKGFTVALKSFIRASTDKMSTDECKVASVWGSEHSGAMACAPMALNGCLVGPICLCFRHLQ